MGALGADCQFWGLAFMLILSCSCGHEMRVVEDAIGRTRTCEQCKNPLPIQRNNTRPEGSPKKLDPARVLGSGVGFDYKRIGEKLVEAHLVTKEQVARALAHQKEKGGKLVENLIQLGFLDIKTFVRFLANTPGIASIDLSKYTIPPEIIELVPMDLAVKHEIFPIDKMGKLLTLGMACPLDVTAIQEIEGRTGLRVKALLCSAEDIRRAIRRYYPDGLEAHFSDAIASSERRISAPSRAINEAKRLDAKRVDAKPEQAESALTFQRLTKLIREMKALPALPATVQNVEAALRDLDVSARDVAHTINHDPPVAAKVLSVANSAAYGFPNRVDSVDLAVALMGLRETYSIVLAAAVLKLFEKSKRYHYEAFWEESMNCAAAAKVIAKSCGYERDHAAFTAGLLHDIGRVALLEVAPEVYDDVPADLDGEALIRAEEEAVGLTHTEAGYELAQQWRLPSDMAEAIRYHHHPEYATVGADLVYIVALAENWTREVTYALDDPDAALYASQHLWQALRMSEAEAMELFNVVSALPRKRFMWNKEEKVPV